MQGRHGTTIHSVKDPPSPLLFSRPSSLCSFYAYETWHHHSRRRHLPVRRLLGALHRKAQARKTYISCKQASTESSPGTPKAAACNREDKAIRPRRFQTHERITPTSTWAERIYTSSETCPAAKHDLTKFDAMAPYSQLSRALVDQEPLCVKAIASKQPSRRTLDSFVIIPSSQKDEIAALRWLTNMGNAYGPSLMLLVGLGYWVQGLRCFPWFAVNFYFKDVLTVDPGTLQVIQNTVNLPMVAKPVYGIISDAVYIRGAHRVPYLAIGGFLQAFSWATIAFLPGNGSSVSIITVLLALSNLGASMVDVANDALVAECAKKKSSTGELQSFAWLSTAVGGILGNLIAAFALSQADFRVMFSMFGMLLACQAGKSMGVDEGSFGLRMLDAIDVDVEQRLEVATKMRPVKVLSNTVSSSNRAPYALAFEEPQDVWSYPSIDVKKVSSYASTSSREVLRWRQSSLDVVSPDYYLSTHRLRSEALVVQEPAKVDRMKQQFIELLDLVKKPEILYPLSWFMASYAMVPTLAGTMFFFQTQHLKIDPAVVGMAKVMGQVGLMGGSMVYSRYLKGMPLRKLLGSVQVLLCVCMLFDILLVKRMNVGLGIPDAALVMGASAFVDAINQFKILPFMVLLAQLCPPGSEGSLLAAFMSVQCLATIISGYMGVTLASMLHITCDDFSELPTGIFVESMAALLPLLWISFIPDKEPRSDNVQYRDGKSK